MPEPTTAGPLLQRPFEPVGRHLEFARSLEAVADPLDDVQFRLTGEPIGPLAVGLEHLCVVPADDEQDRGPDLVKNFRDHVDATAAGDDGVDIVLEARPTPERGCRELAVDGRVRLRFERVVPGLYRYSPGPSSGFPPEVTSRNAVSGYVVPALGAARSWTPSLT